jgi:copper resistance protein C
VIKEWANNMNELKAYLLRRLTARPRLFRVCVLFSALLWTSPDSAWAHAILVRSLPPANSTISGKDLNIELVFNSQIDGRRSRLLLVDEHNKELVLAGVMQPKPEVLKARVTGLSEGTYVVRWQVLAIDGHISRGQISLTLRGMDATLGPPALQGIVAIVSLT